jgi:tRNA (cytidine/uridine-2'-O-)-methyltransferase
MRLALFQPDIPQNLGAALRLGACLGVAIGRAAMDYGERAEVRRHASWTDFRAQAAVPGRRLVLFTTTGAVRLPAFRFEPGDVLLFGRESAGAPAEVHEAADARVFIPLAPGARSLNLVTAAAMGLAEALRQTDGYPAAP